MTIAPRLFEVGHLESIGPHIYTLFLGLFGLWTFRLLYQHNRRSVLLPLYIVCWYVACAAGIWEMNKLKWFNHWMRYVIPVHGLLCAWSAVALFDLLDQPVGVDSAGSWPLTTRRWAMRAVSVGLIGVFLWLAPWTTLRKWSLRRFFNVSAKPTSSVDTKRKKARWGPAYAGWKKADRIAEKSDGNILSADTRIWYMLTDDRVVYDTRSLPKSANTAHRVLRWLRRHNVTVLIEDAGRGFLQFGRGDKKYGTTVWRAIQSEGIEHVTNTAGHKIYRVVR